MARRVFSTEAAASVEAYLRDLEGELGRSLPPEDLQARLTEAEAHLRDGIEGRIELGLDPDVATLESIKAFGAARSLASATSAPSNVTHRIRLMVVSLAFGVLLFHLLWAVVPVPGLALGLCAVVYLGMVATFGSLAFRSRRPATAHLLLSGVLGSLGVWLTFGLTAVGRPGSGILPREKLADCRTSLGRAIDRSARNEALLAREERRLDAEGIAALALNAGYRTPVEPQPWDARPLIFRVVSDPRFAASEVRRVSRNVSAGTAALRNDLANMERAERSPLYNLSEEYEVPEANMAWVAGLVLVDLAFGVMGRLAHRRPSRTIRA